MTICDNCWSTKDVKLVELDDFGRASREEDRRKIRWGLCVNCRGLLLDGEWKSLASRAEGREVGRDDDDFDADSWRIVERL